MRSAEEIWKEALRYRSKGYDDAAIFTAIRTARREAIEAAAKWHLSECYRLQNTSKGAATKRAANECQRLADFHSDSAAAISALLPTDTQEPTMPAPPASAGERDE